MSVVLKLTTKPTLFEPVEIDIDGEILRVKPITLGGLERIQALQEKAGQGSIAAIREMIGTLFEGNLEILSDLPLDSAVKLIEVAVEKSVKPGTEEKNLPGPGDAGLH